MTGECILTHKSTITILNLKNSIYIFIDASNLWQAQKAKGKFMNYEKTLKHIKEKFSGNEVKGFFYTAYPASGTRGYSLDGKHKFYTYLKKGLGFVVRKKELKRITTSDKHGELVREKGNMDVEIVIDAMHQFKNYDTAVFFTGDSDFLALITYLKNRDKKVYVFSSKNNVSTELRTGSDGYFDVLEEDIWGRELKYRKERE